MIHAKSGRVQIGITRLARSKQIITDDQTEDDNDDGEKAICNKKHDRHTDAEPE